MIYGYLRVSSDEQDVNSQKQGVEKFAEQKGWEIEQYIIDPDYRSMWSPWNCGWYIWEVSRGRRFVISLGTKEIADEVCKKYQEWHDSCNDGQRFVVEESDVRVDG